MRKTLLPLFLLVMVFTQTISAQELKPGFDAREYLNMLYLTSHQVDTPLMKNRLPIPDGYQRAYSSPVVGLENHWALWVNEERHLIVISLRGTTASLSSWLENFYAAMVPAIGSIQLNDSTTFNYKFANDPKATVHVGWTVGIGSMVPTIIPKVKEYYNQGFKNIIIIGHSQGGALAFLLRSYMYYQQQDGTLPKDLIIKTYCSAAPKPGNTFYAYDFDYITRGGWAYRIVNAADWVPEVPIGVQTTDDFNALNPFTNAKKSFKKRSFFIRLYLTHGYNRLDKPTKRARKNFKKYLGKRMYVMVKRYMSQLKQPHYANTDNYTPAGIPIILEPDALYHRFFPDNPKNVFTHHDFLPYIYLTKNLYNLK